MSFSVPENLCDDAHPPPFVFKENGEIQLNPLPLAFHDSVSHESPGARILPLEHLNLQDLLSPPNKKVKQDNPVRKALFKLPAAKRGNKNLNLTTSKRETYNISGISHMNKPDHARPRRTVGALSHGNLGKRSTTESTYLRRPANSIVAPVSQSKSHLQRPQSVSAFRPPLPVKRKNSEDSGSDKSEFLQLEKLCNDDQYQGTAPKQSAATVESPTLFSMCVLMQGTSLKEKSKGDSVTEMRVSFEELIHEQDRALAEIALLQQKAIERQKVIKEMMLTINQVKQEALTKVHTQKSTRSAKKWLLSPAHQKTSEIDLRKSTLKKNLIPAIVVSDCTDFESPRTRRAKSFLQETMKDIGSFTPRHGNTPAMKLRSQCYDLMHTPAKH